MLKRALTPITRNTPLRTSTRTLTLTLVLTTGLITIFILVISVIGKWSVVCVLCRARDYTTPTSYTYTSSFLMADS